MGYSAKAGSFNIDTTKTVGQTQAISGLGFQPKVVLFFWSGSTASVDTVSGGTFSMGFGVASSSSSRWNLTALSTDASASSASQRTAYTTECVRVYSANNVLDGLLDFSSMDADGFTLVVDDQFTNAYRVSYLALGGTDLTNVFIGSKQMPTTTGNYNVTGVGFQPDCLITASHISTSKDNRVAGINICFGMATGASNQGVISGYTQDAQATMNTLGYGYDGEVLAAGNNNYREAFVSFGADGFTLNNLEGAAAGWYFYVALKGGRYSVGSLTTRTDGNDIAVTAPAFQPAALLFLSANRALSTQDTATDNLRMSIGAATSTGSRAAAAVSDEDALADSETAYANYDSAVYVNVVDDAAAGVMDLKSIDVAGFTCVMDDTDPSGCWVTYLAIGANATNQTINLDTATLTASGQSLTITKGAVSIALQTATLAATGQTASIGKGPVSIGLDTATLTATGQTASITKGAVSINLDTATLTATGQQITVSAGGTPQTVNLDTAVLTASGQSLTVTKGAVSVTLDTATLTATGQQLGVTPGAVTVNLDAANLTATGQTLTPTPGAVTVNLSTAALAASGQSITLVKGGVTVNLDTATLSAAGQPITLTPGAVTVNLDTASLTATGQQATITTGVIVNLDTATLTATGQPITIGKGAVSVGLDTATLTATGQQAGITAGAVTVGLDTAVLTATGQTITVSTTGGAIVITLDTATLTASGQTLTVTVGDTLATLVIGDALVTSLGISDALVTSLAVGDELATGLNISDTLVTTTVLIEALVTRLIVSDR